MKFILTSLFCFCLVVLLEAQSLLGVPDIYYPPEDYYFNLDINAVERDRHINNPTLKQNPDIAWRVINDRAGNVAYKSPEDGSDVQEKLDYLRSYFVTEVKGTWIRIVRIDGGNPVGKRPPSNGSTKDMGWVRRNDILLWSQGLVDIKSRITVKGLLLNSSEDIVNILKLDKKELVKVYDSPESNNSTGQIRIYEIYYVLKRESNRVLLSKDYVYGANPENTIIGWVDNKRLERWTTRIAIEPNHSQAAFNERKLYPNNRFVFFRHTNDVNKMLTSGEIINPIFNQDPVILAPEMLAKSNPLRYKGSVIRYPILSNHDNYFRTGIIGSITTFGPEGQDAMDVMDMSHVDAEFQELRQEDDKVNVYFMIEGGLEMNNYKAELTNMIQSLSGKLKAENLRIGCAIYRDFQGKQFKPVENKPLTQNKNQIIEFIKNQTFYTEKGDDEYTVQRFALKKVLKEGGWQPDQRNILVIIGSGADIAASSTRSLKDKKSEYFVSDENVTSIYKSLADLQMNVLYFQAQNKEDKPSESFRTDSQELLSDVAKMIYNESFKAAEKSGEKLNVPVIPDYEAGKFMPVHSAANYYGMYTTTPGKNTTGDQFVGEIYKGIKTFNAFRDGQINAISEVIEKGESLDVTPGEFQPYYWQFVKNRLKGVDPATLRKLTNEKYQLFEKAYVPKQAKDRTYPLYSYVLFLPKTELVDFIDNLKPLTIKLGAGTSPKELRHALKQALTETVQKLSSQSNIAETEDTDMNKTLSIIIGMDKEGVVVFKNLRSKKIKDLTKEKVFSDDEIIELAESFRKLREKLIIIKNSSNYEFSFRREGDDENVYYWIALTEIFDNNLF